MKPSESIQLGAKREEEFTVGEQHTAKHVGSGTMRVLATPMMIAFMELNTRRLLDDMLPEGYSTVGVHVHIDHYAPSAQGNQVVSRCEVLNVDGERVTLNVEVWDGDTKVGGGIHSRHVIDVARFMARVGGE